MADSAPRAPLPGWPDVESPFHAGEQAIQERAGVRARAEQIGRRGVRDFMPDQHRELFTKLPFLVAGALDGAGHPRATVLAGPPGFVGSPDARTLTIAAQPAAGDPLAGRLVVGAPVGLLGIQLETRRRNRMNGTIVAADGAGFTVYVGQSFGNCPRYIQAREPYFVDAEAPAPPRPEGARLSPSAAALVAAADTFFIASAAPGARGGDAVAGVDVSHRGGPPGFVRLDDDGDGTVLTVPDYNGNLHFNTLGNLALEPRAGLVFPDFTSGGLLSLAARAEIVWDGPEVASVAGAERLVRLRVDAGVWLPAALPLRWSAPTPSPHLPKP